MKYSEIEKTYAEMLPLYRQLKDEVDFIIKSALKHTTIKIHTVASRVKTLESLSNKTRAKQFKQPFEEIKDVVGFRIVCLFLSDISSIGEIIRNTFDVLSEDNKIEEHETSSFGYLSVHFIARLKRECKGPRYDKIKNLAFEIQVRTIAMDSWATISHYLDYKNEEGIPSELRRDFYALSGLFYVADTHFQMFYNESKKSRERMRKVFENTQVGLQQEINLDSLLVYLQRKFPNREHSKPDDVSWLVAELKLYGYRRISDIDKAVRKAWQIFEKYEKEQPPRDIETGSIVRFADVGVVRTVLALCDEQYSRMKGYSDIAAYRNLLNR